jgi:membrane-associated protease RseP (regulator of RpoE activity)
MNILPIPALDGGHVMSFFLKSYQAGNQVINSWNMHRLQEWQSFLHCSFMQMVMMLLNYSENSFNLPGLLMNKEFITLRKH